MLCCVKANAGDSLKQCGGGRAGKWARTSKASLFHDFYKLLFTEKTLNLVFRILGDWHCQKDLVNNHFTLIPTSSSNVFRFIFIFRLRGWSGRACRGQRCRRGVTTFVSCTWVQRTRLRSSARALSGLKPWRHFSSPLILPISIKLCETIL